MNTIVINPDSISQDEDPENPFGELDADIQDAQDAEDNELYADSADSSVNVYDFILEGLLEPQIVTLDPPSENSQRP